MVIKFMQVVACQLMFSSLLALTVGSDVAVSVEPFASFPENPLLGIPNKINAFAWMKNGFELENAATTCIFASIYPVAGTFDGRSGMLDLSTDLIFQNNIQFLSPSSITGNNHQVVGCESITGLAGVGILLFDNAQLFLKNDLTVSCTLHIKGNILIDGGSNTIILDDNACIMVDHGSTLELRNLEIDGIKTGKFYCADDTAHLVLNNMRWVQADDYTFTNGSILFTNQVNFVGPYLFQYDSSLSSTIDYDSTWYLCDVVTLRMGRKQGVFGREPLNFFDRSSVLKLENCAVEITSSGAQWTKGTIFIDREVTFDIDSTSTVNGMLLGNGNGDEDLVWQLYPAAAAKLIHGHMVNDIVNVENFCSGKVTSKFIRAGDSIFYSKQNVEMVNTELGLYDQSDSQVVPGKAYRHTNVLINTPVGEMVFTGTRFQSYENYLDGNCSIRLITGCLPLPFTIQNTNNIISGAGDVIAPLFVYDKNAELTFQLDGIISNAVVLNAGKIILDRDLQLGQDISFSGFGSVDLGAYSCAVRLKDTVWTSTIAWVGERGTLKLDSNLTVVSPFEFSGDCMIDGNNNELDLKGAGTITVKKNSTLYLKNLTVNGLAGFNFACQDNSASIVLDNVKIVLSDTFTFTQGSLLAINNFDIVGAYTCKYDSPLTSTISLLTRVGVNENVRFEIGRHNSTTDREPIYFTDRTSEVDLNGAVLAINENGFNFKRGTLVLSSKVSFEMNGTSSMHGLKFGDGVNPENDSYIIGNTGTMMHFVKGPWVYAGVSPNNLESFGANCEVCIYPAFNIYVETDLVFPSITIDLVALGWGLYIEPGKCLWYNNTVYSFGDVQFRLNCLRYNMYTILLDGLNYATPLTGIMPFNTLVTGPGNVLQGFGGVSGLIILQDSSAQLSLGLSGGILNDVQLNGGRVTLARQAQFADNKIFTGDGTIALGALSTQLGGQSLRSTGTLYWDSSGGYLSLRSNLALNGLWTFSGNATIYGNNNSILMGRGGSIKVERGSTLTFKDLTVKGITADSLWCVDDAANIVLDNVLFELDADYTFSKGKFSFYDTCYLSGEDKAFTYQSAMQSLIKSRATLYFDRDFTFAYAPNSASSTLFGFEDQTSKLIMAEATLHSTSTGLHLTKGTMEIIDHCYLASDASIKANGIVLGDGDNSANDVVLDLHPDSNLELYSGYVVYKNIM